MALIVVLATAPLAAQQSDEGWLDSVWHTLRDPDAPTWYGGIWKSWSDTTTQGDSSVIVPISAYHMRFYYPPEKIARYTEWPLGIGFGRTHVGETTTRVVFGLAMQDSHGTPEYEIGYIWLRNRYPRSGSRDFHLGFGYSLNLMVREQFGYRPLPILLPMATIGYRRLTIGTTYIPGAGGIGNVLLTGAHVSF